MNLWPRCYAGRGRGFAFLNLAQEHLLKLGPRWLPDVRCPTLRTMMLGTNVRRSLASAATVVLVAGLMLVTTPPASADHGCTSPRWPAFTSVARTADRVLVGTVRRVAGAGRSSSRFTLDVEAYRGPGPVPRTVSVRNLRSGLPSTDPRTECGPVAVQVSVGARIAIAYDGAAPSGRQVNTVARIDGDVGAFGAQRLTMKEVRRATRRAADGSVLRATPRDVSRGNGTWTVEASLEDCLHAGATLYPEDRQSGGSRTYCVALDDEIEPGGRVLLTTTFPFRRPALLRMMAIRGCRLQTGMPSSAPSRRFMVDATDWPEPRKVCVRAIGDRDDGRFRSARLSLSCNTMGTETMVPVTRMARDFGEILGQYAAGIRTILGSTRGSGP